MISPLPHGGRLIEAQRRYPAAPRPFIDLSTGINPEAYPFVPPDAACWQRLPEPEDVAALEAAAANAYGIVDPAMVVAAPGTQAIIQLLPSLFPQHRIGIAGLTYGEHAAAWTAAGTVVADDADARVVCNPNNPDGARHEPSVLAAHTHRLLVVDEAFTDFEPGLSLAPFLPVPRTIVLRSFGKAYGLAGLRLGFALTDPAAATRMRGALGPWAVSGPAIAIGRQALGDPAWRDAAGRRAAQAAERLDRLLQGAGFEVVGGTSLFRLAQASEAAPVAEGLARQGILVRAFAAAPGWLRFGLPGDEESWERLSGALRAVTCRE